MYIVSCEDSNCGLRSGSAGANAAMGIRQYLLYPSCSTPTSLEYLFSTKPTDCARTGPNIPTAISTLKLNDVLTSTGATPMSPNRKWEWRPHATDAQRGMSRILGQSRMDSHCGRHPGRTHPTHVFIANVFGGRTPIVDESRSRWLVFEPQVGIRTPQRLQRGRPT